ncbi:MAG TPA: hypothetical protein VFL70_10885 [Bacteroidia bacterium]|nr:hypothetical protein [Bacteroidia bacterium]
MKTLLNILATLILLFNGIGAIYGGWLLIINPDGTSLQLPLDLLTHSPFNDYLIPGIILFTANGLFSFFVLLGLIFKFRNYAYLLIAQGVILLGWIIIQILLVRTFYYLQVIFFIV